VRSSSPEIREDAVWTGVHTSPSNQSNASPDSACFGGNDTLASRARFNDKTMTRASRLVRADAFARVRHTATKVSSFQVERGRYKSDRGAA